ncbi:hypothetical protein RJ639_031880 [Escallonia herrerae]|uniref:DUF4283 domain-containing protein n=1 Tax=Escallonia herrerae TaxID=1293975 RepID=A0AA88X283_9ASTE|nr:hypothetical protein RJ639_031880 [Escallonia herrerae]
MEEDLIGWWQKFSLAEEEHEGLNLEDDVSTEDLDEVCLVGKVLTNRSFNEEAMKKTARLLWRATKGVTISDLDQNLFIFRFTSEAKRSWVIRQGPWHFENNLLVFKQFRGEEQPSTIKFLEADFWVHVLNLPLGSMNSSVGERIGNKIGKYISMGVTPS